jgi:hypothetical protein
MLASIRSAAVLGIEAYEVTVEVDVTPSLPSFTMVGTEPLRYAGGSHRRPSVPAIGGAVPSPWRPP